MKDCLFLVADKNMEGMFKGFFGREDWHRALGCAPFTFDIVVAHGQNDSGLYTRAGELLQPLSRSYRHAVVVMDAAWGGSPGAEKIQERLRQHLQAAGWLETDTCAVVIDPELENWVWQDSPHVCAALGFDGEFAVLREQLGSQDFWNAGRLKPQRPKEAVEWLLCKARKPRSSAIYQKLAGQVSLRRCQDDAFQHLRETLGCWFPNPPA